MSWFVSHGPNAPSEDTPLVEKHKRQLHAETGLPRSLSFIIPQVFAVIVSSLLLLGVVAIGLATRFLQYLLGYRKPIPREKPEWDDEERWKHELLVKSPQYYARSCGFDIIDEQVETLDGYFLRIHHVKCLNKDESIPDIGRGYPILIMHGLFQSSGSFITSEDRSLAFWFAQRGYDVYMGNNRAIFDMGHRTYTRYSPHFWDFNIRDLAQYDLPAMIDYVCARSKHDKLAYIGHSQGNALAFMALSKWYHPELGDKISYFAALAPAVFIGPLAKQFPLKYLSKLDWKWWRLIFGTLDFVPLMKFSYDWTPATPYAALGYQMFAYLFEWKDTHWLLRRKPKMFRFTPMPVSSAAMFWWAGKDGFATRGALFDPNKQWFDHRFPPLAIFGGDQDHLVRPHPFIDHMKNREPAVNVIRADIQSDAEVRTLDVVYRSIAIITGLRMPWNGVSMIFLVCILLMH